MNNKIVSVKQKHISEETQGFNYKNLGSRNDLKLNSEIWRFMSYEKFLHMLINKELYFADPNKFEDRNEGMPGLNEMVIPALIYGKKKSLEDLKKWRLELSNYGVSCWYASPIESLAIWDLYAGRNNGIAIKLKIKDLIESLKGNIDGDLYLGHIKYNLAIQKGNVWDYYNLNPLERLFKKHPSYRHEKEFRAIIKINDSNRNLKLDLSKLIKEIIIPPQAMKGTCEVIQHLCKENDLNAKVSISDLDLSVEDQLRQISNINDEPYQLEEI